MKRTASTIKLIAAGARSITADALFSQNIAMPTVHRCDDPLRSIVIRTREEFTQIVKQHNLMRK
jgi:hypothetical protein